MFKVNVEGWVTVGGWEPASFLFTWLKANNLTKFDSHLSFDRYLTVTSVTVLSPSFGHPSDLTAGSFPGFAFDQGPTV